MNLDENLERYILNMAAVENLNELSDVFHKSITSCLKSVINCYTFILKLNSDLLENSNLCLKFLPMEGIFRYVYEKRISVILNQNEINSSDPALQLLSNSPLHSNIKFIISPIINSKDEKIIAVYMLTIRNPLNDHIQILSFIEKQFIACYNRLQNQHSLNYHNSIFQLCADLYNENIEILQMKIISYLKNEINCEAGILMLVNRLKEEFYCTVINDNIISKQIRIPILNDFLKKYEILKDVSIFKQSHLSVFEEHLGFNILSCLCMPILDSSDQKPLAYLCLFNKTYSNFLDSDVRVVLQCFKYISLVLHMAISLESEKLVKQQTQVLLQVSQNLFAHLGNINNLLKEIMCEARGLVEAERCSLFLLDQTTDELVAKVFDGNSTPLVGGKDVRISLNDGIAGHVASTGTFLNIDDVYSHPLFYKEIDRETGFITRNILCLPIKDESGNIIGVAQLCNKINGHRFTDFDVEIAQAFSIFCCISIVQCLLYTKLKESQDRSKLSNELMIYHMKVSPQEVVNLACLDYRNGNDFNIDNLTRFKFISRDIQAVDMPKTIMFMFHDLGFIKKYNIKKDTLARFILMVRKGYRSPPYHNWSHAFAVTHFCYLLFKNTKVRKLLSDVESLALFVSCLCHDIDHRGTNNSFQIASETVLAALYSSGGSVLERHHFAQSVCIINTDECNIFENVEEQDYIKILDLMHDIILSTDLAHHVSQLNELQKMAINGYDSTKESNKLLLSILMTSCDLSDQTKSFENSKTIAEKIYMEFFSQGDMEKANGLNPTENMDRDKAVIPDLQIGFLKSIAIPVYELLAIFLPETQEVLKAVEANINSWQELNEQLIKNNLRRNMSIFKLDLSILEASKN